MTLSDYSHPAAESPLGIRLARFYLTDDFWSIEEMRSRINRIGFGTAALAFIPALERNSASAFLWCDAGEALLANGDAQAANGQAQGANDNEQRAAYCYHTAASLAPHDARILFAVADYYTRIGDPPHAVPPFAAILTLTDDQILTYNVFTYFERLQARRNGLLEEAIRDARAGRGYLRYLIAKDDPAAVHQLWNLAQERSYDDDRLTEDYTAFLLRKKQFAAAAEAWGSHFSGRDDGYPESTLVFNGGFEYELTGSDLDWRFDGFSGVKVDRDRQSRYEGQYSLRIGFAGNDNPDFHHVRQLVFVQPGRYRFEAQMRTDLITSDEGVRFRIQTAERNAPLLVETAPLTGTNAWRRVTAEFEVPPGFRMVAVELARRRSIRIDYQLTGTAWIDAVRLTHLQ